MPATVIVFTLALDFAIDAEAVGAIPTMPAVVRAKSAVIARNSQPGTQPLTSVLPFVVRT